MNALVAFIFPGALELLLVCLLFVLTAVVPILVVFWFARKMLENKRENTRLRLEVSKLAHELEQSRKPKPEGGTQAAEPSP